MDIKICELNKNYGKNLIFKNFNISFESNKVNSIIGKSGCGKSTLLNIIASLVEKDSGEIIGIDKQDISYIFQEDRLIDWLTVGENLSLILKNFYGKEQVSYELKELLKKVDMDNYENQYPQSLSGGMRQRINIARAFAKPSKVIIMDEPFKSIDIKNKISIMNCFKTLLKNENRTVIFVTHDVDEAIFFNDNIYVLGESPVKIKGVFKENLYDNRENIIKLI